MSVLSVGSVAGTLVPALFDLAEDSINSGTNLRTGRGEFCEVTEVGLCSLGVGAGVSSGGAAFLLLETVVSIGSGANRLRGGSLSSSVSAKSVVAIPSVLFLLLRNDVSMGSGTNFLFVFVVVSTGSGKNLLRGGDVPDMM